ncbi:MAG TPA: response regulator [Candidatus Copromonas faecavium]|uniref:Stage 0 sporulation protein A homolog n=1 Tax=Candidatus Copromonas faecavium (nom. illeg.) TaxID=2840740 RepID=A0A9D1D4Y5_9FIRM|nr:response regulator [Candidatus Copromonas faecavium]
MDLYRIILVDDEEEVRKSIIRKIDWTSVGFTVVGDAENGEEALEKIEGLEPDVVLTDIRMPYMDGLTLAERIRQKYPSMKIVIFSGYDDFEYAKRAIKLNVTEYILKPVNVEELTAILKRIKTNLDEEIEQKRNVTLLRENYRKSLPILREQFLKDLISRPMEKETVLDLVEEYGIPLAGAKKWIAIAVELEQELAQEDAPLPLHEEKNLIPISVIQIMEENLKPYYRFSLVSFSGTAEAEIAGIVAVDNGNSQTGLIDILGDICKEIRKLVKVPVTIGIGHSAAELGNISVSFKSALDALGYRAIVGTGGTIYINDVEPVSGGKLQFGGEDESAFVQAIKFGPEEKIEEAVQQIVKRMSDARVHVRQYQAYVLSVANCMIQLTQQYDLNLEEIFADDPLGLDPFTVIQQALNRDNFSRWLYQAALKINGAMNRERDNTARQVMEKAKQYIMDNYQDPDLSVEQICRYLHMSPAYFSTMFKKATGQTYVAYLTEIRLNKAVELLNMTDDKTYVIASKVGYQEQNYFSYVFKKRFGVSPTKFRGNR